MQFETNNTFHYYRHTKAQRHKEKNTQDKSEVDTAKPPIYYQRTAIVNLGHENQIISFIDRCIILELFIKCL